jgi:hypothetical protein
MPALRIRLLVSMVLGTAGGVFCWFLMARLRQGAGDFVWAIRAADALLAGRNPYADAKQLYPLPAALFGLPFVRMRPEIAAGVFYGISSGLLAFGLTRDGYRRLLIFMAYPYWVGMLFVQWPTLIMASAFFPLLLPVTLGKPQTGLPVALTSLSRKGVIACVVVVLVSFLVLPRWVVLWLANGGGYPHFFPLLVLPGPMLALSLLRYRDRDAWFLLCAACVPQRWFYDQFLLWLIPKTRREIVYTAGLSWAAGIWRWYHGPPTLMQVGRWTVVCMYLPMLVVVLLRGRKGSG